MSVGASARLVRRNGCRRGFRHGWNGGRRWRIVRSQGGAEIEGAAVPCGKFPIIGIDLRQIPRVLTLWIDTGRRAAENGRAGRLQRSRKCGRLPLAGVGSQLQNADLDFSRQPFAVILFLFAAECIAARRGGGCGFAGWSERRRGTVNAIARASPERGCCEYRNHDMPRRGHQGVHFSTMAALYRRFEGHFESYQWRRSLFLAGRCSVAPLPSCGYA